MPKPKLRVVENEAGSDEKLTAIYVRVTQEESVKTDLSVPNQKNRALEICAERAWSPAKLYIEPRHVGGELGPAKRPALAELLADIEAGRVERVLVRHTDRLWRGSRVQDLILDLLRRHSVELWDFGGLREHRTAGGRFALKVLGAAAELEKGLTGERIREMKRGKAKSGKNAGGPPPFGFTSHGRARREARASGMSEDEAERLASERYPLTRAFYVDDKEAEIVRLVFEMYLENRCGSRRIAEALNRAGHRRRGGFLWSPVKVGRVINNPVVAGFTSFDEEAYEKGIPSKSPRYRQTLYPGSQPAIIAPERWREAQRLKTEVNALSLRTKTSGRARVYPLTGVLRCGKCGAHMRGKSSGTAGSANYVCSRRAYYGTTDGCAGASIHQAWAEITVWNYLDQLFQSPELIATIVARASGKVKRDLPDVKKRLTSVRAEISKLEAKQRKWMERYEGTDDSESAEILWARIRELKAQQIELRTEEEALSAKLARAAGENLAPDDVSRALSKLQGFESAPPEKRRILVERLAHRHDLRIRNLDGRRLAVSLRLDPVEDDAPRNGVGRRLVLVGEQSQVVTSGGGRPLYPGSPVPGGPASSTLWPPATAISTAARASCWPRTSAMSLYGAAGGRRRGAAAGRSAARPASASISSRT